MAVNGSRLQNYDQQEGCSNCSLFADYKMTTDAETAYSQMDKILDR